MDKYNVLGYKIGASGGSKKADEKQRALLFFPEHLRPSLAKLRIDELAALQAWIENRD